MLQTIAITDRDTWLQARMQDVTSTEISALYGLSPYKTAFELWHEKRAGVVVQLPPNERMTWGLRLESAIAQGAAEDAGWVIRPLNIYLRDTDDRIGSSFDFEILESEHGYGILECKNVDTLAYSRNWTDDGDGRIEAPAHIELQVQHQLEVADCDWAAIAVLVGGNTKKVIRRERDRQIGADIRATVRAFWASINADQPPRPDLSQDADVIRRLYSQANDGEVVVAGLELEQLIQRYHQQTTAISDLERSRDQTRAEILMQIGTASKVMTSFGSLATGNTKGHSGTLITEDMVGQTIGARAGYRQFRFHAKKEKPL